MARWGYAWGLLALSSWLAAAPCQAGQLSPECKDAYEFLISAKERLFAGDASRADLQTLHFQSQLRTRQCGDLKELWQLRADLARQLKDDKDLDVVKLRSSGSMIEKVYPRHGPFNPAAPIGRRWALLAGTNTFQNKSDLGVMDLEYAEADVRLIEKTLSSTFGFSDVETLLGPAFTLEAWRSSFARLREQVNEDDLVLVYLASHGKPTSADSNNTSFLLTYGSQGPQMPRIYASSLQVIDLVQELSRELRAQRVIILIDSCFSGDAISGQRDHAGRPAPYLLDAFTRGSGRAVFTAARANQPSKELTALKQGVFAYCFAKGATATATLGELFAAVEACVGAQVKALGPNESQTPQLFVSEGARSIVLGAKR